MSRPSKPSAVIKQEKKSHRTKAELEQREKHESALLSGQKMFERQSVKTDEAAHKEYLRLSKLMKAIGKNDALYAPAINRYCELYSEIEFTRGENARLRKLVDKLEEEFDNLEDVDGDDIRDFAKQLVTLLRQINAGDAAIMTKRKMMLDIEDKNCMNVSAALRTIPKDVDKDKDDDILKKVLMEE